MSNTMAKKDFYSWIFSLKDTELEDMDKRLLQLLVDKFDVIIHLSTARGARPKKIGEFIESEIFNYNSKMPSITNCDEDLSKICRQITTLSLGPFRGFSREETFAFDKNYILMYGPNGSGKSSFCEALEYALLGSIEEAESKRVDTSKYCRNAQTNTMVNPTIQGTTFDGTLGVIEANQDFYRFSFIEKNRIDGFARISASVPSAQQSRIATLFGLDAFNDFVNGFTDTLSGAHLMMENQKEVEFNKKNQLYENSKVRIKELQDEYVVLRNSEIELLREISREDICTIEKARVFLVGEDGTKGIIGELHEKKAAVIPENIDTSITTQIRETISEMKRSYEALDIKLIQYQAYATDVNFKELYTTIAQLSNDDKVNKRICPACRTPVDKVVSNPFNLANDELTKMGMLAEIQTEIERLSQQLIHNVKLINNLFVKVTDVQKQLKQTIILPPLLTEISYSGVNSAKLLCGSFTGWMNEIKTQVVFFDTFDSEVIKYNDALQKCRDDKKTMEVDILKYQKLKEKHDEIITLGKKAGKEIDEAQQMVKSFEDKK